MLFDGIGREEIVQGLTGVPVPVPTITVRPVDPVVGNLWRLRTALPATDSVFHRHRLRKWRRLPWRYVWIPKGYWLLTWRDCHLHDVLEKYRKAPHPAVAEMRLMLQRAHRDHGNHFQWLDSAYVRFRRWVRVAPYRARYRWRRWKQRIKSWVISWS